MSLLSQNYGPHGGARVRLDIEFGADLRLDVYYPPRHVNHRTAVVLLHGGAIRRGDRRLISARAEELSSHGFTCVAAQYRVVEEAPFPAALIDAKDAIRWVRSHAAELEIDPARIAVQGWSAGAQLALLAAGTPDDPRFAPTDPDDEVSDRVAAVVAYYPVIEMHKSRGTEHYGEVFPPSDRRQLEADVRENGSLPAWVVLGDDQDDERLELLSPLNVVSDEFPPSLLIHGTSDTLVPAEGTLRMYDALKQSGVSVDLLLMSDQPHGFDLTFPFVEALQLQSAFFLRRMIVEGVAMQEAQEAARASLGIELAKRRGGNPRPSAT